MTRFRGSHRFTPPGGPAPYRAPRDSRPYWTPPQRMTLDQWRSEVTDRGLRLVSSERDPGNDPHRVEIWAVPGQFPQLLVHHDHTGPAPEVGISQFNPTKDAPLGAVDRMADQFGLPAHAYLQVGKIT